MALCVVQLDQEACDASINPQTCYVLSSKAYQEDGDFQSRMWLRNAAPQGQKSICLRHCLE